MPRLVTVLIIEDVPLQLDMYEMALHDLGYSVLRATRGHTGYDVAVTEQPDVIITDLALPDVDGWVVCAWLKANPITTAIPVIILTARDDYDIPIRAQHANVAALLHKPCPADRLKAAIDGALRGSWKDYPDEFQSAEPHAGSERLLLLLLNGLQLRPTGLLGRRNLGPGRRRHLPALRGMAARRVTVRSAPLGGAD